MKSILKIFSLPVAATLLFAVIFLAACTKADYSDDFKPSSRPPISGYSAANDVAKDAMVAKWSFEGILTDSVGNLTATKDTAETYVPGRSGMGQGLQFGEGSYVIYGDAGAVLPAMQSFSVAFWIYAAPSNGKARGIFSLNRADDFWGNLDIYQENYTADNTTLYFKVHIYNGNVAWAGQFTETKISNAMGRWMHVAVTYDGGTSAFRIYADNQLQTVSTAGNQPSTTPTLNGDDPNSNPKPYGPVKFVNAKQVVMGTWQFQTYPSTTTGGGHQDWAGSFLGGIDELRIYNRALTTREVSALFKLDKLGL